MRAAIDSMWRRGPLKRGPVDAFNGRALQHSSPPSHRAALRFDSSECAIGPNPGDPTVWRGFQEAGILKCEIGDGGARLPAGLLVARRWNWFVGWSKKVFQYHNLKTCTHIASSWNVMLFFNDALYISEIGDGSARLPVGSLSQDDEIVRGVISFKQGV